MNDLHPHIIAHSLTNVVMDGMQGCIEHTQVLQDWYIPSSAPIMSISADMLSIRCRGLFYVWRQEGHDFDCLEAVAVHSLG